ncbi:MAG: PilW family protein, partial [Anaerolineae bacterium]
MAICFTKPTAARPLLQRRGSAGFALVEALIATALIAVVLLAIFTIWFGLQRTYAFTEEDMRAQQEARSALAEMVEIIRTARRPQSPPSEDLDLVIVSADGNSLICWSDVDRDPQHDLELVRFRVDPQARTLYR